MSKLAVGLLHRVLYTQRHSHCQQISSHIFFLYHLEHHLWKKNEIQILMSGRVGEGKKTDVSSSPLKCTLSLCVLT
jgi:hypothetical protein